MMTVMTKILKTMMTMMPVMIMDPVELIVTLGIEDNGPSVGAHKPNKTITIVLLLIW